MEQTLAGRRVLLVMAGGIAAYKALDLIRRLRERGAAVRCIMTKGAQEFVTPLAAASLSEDRVYTDLFSLTDESEMGHIRLSREADLIVVAPATADLLAKMAAGLADDLASTCLLATDKKVLVAPSMNVMMWGHAATQANMALLERRGIHRVGPDAGDLACGETGSGRMAEPLAIVAAIEGLLGGAGKLAGFRALVTSGPTWEAIDPVRYIANRSSGKQGYAIAAALAEAGAAVTLVSGPSHEQVPPGVAVIRVETAEEMLAASLSALPADIAICAAAVADWRVAPLPAKLKKRGGEPPLLSLIENPDILATLAAVPNRPRLVIGFAAETENVLENAAAKRRRKGCDWILANDVSAGTNAFGGDRNTLHLLTGHAEAPETWADLTKRDLARALVQRIAKALA
jgi:phosphopantothenoylcysteine decarboxylase/phosphopantothenate--cysteine ligase